MRHPGINPGARPSTNGSTIDDAVPQTAFPQTSDENPRAVVTRNVRRPYRRTSPRALPSGPSTSSTVRVEVGRVTAQREVLVPRPYSRAMTRRIPRRSGLVDDHAV